MHASTRRTTLPLTLAILGALGGVAGCAATGGVGALEDGIVTPTEAGFVPRGRPEAVEEAVGAVSPERVMSTVASLCSFGTRHTLSETASDSRGIGAARRWTLDAFAEAVAPAGRRGSVFTESFTQSPVEGRMPRPTEIVNVGARLEGTTEPGREIYLLAHLDSRASERLDAEIDSPGANDDASGVALLVEAARVLATAELDATVVFVATSGEEQGLFGAIESARLARARGADIVAVLNNDTVGDPIGVHEPGGPRARASRSVVRLFSRGVDPAASPEDVARLSSLGAESDSPARQLARYVSEVAHRHDLDVKPALVFRNDRFLRGGDHTAFLREGFGAAVRFTVPYEDYDRQHQDVREEARPDGTVRRYGDTPEWIDPDYLAGVTRLNVAAAAHLANAPGAPEDVRVLVADLSADSTLRWRVGSDADLTGYEVVARRTTSPVWERVTDVGLTGEATVDLSKDNWIFGVRAYDADGYRSLVTPAGAARE